MKMIVKIARMELQKMFYSPIAWLILIIFALQSGISYMGIIKQWVTYSELGYAVWNLTFRTYSSPMGGLFVSIQQNLYLYIPLLTMGLLSKEFASGSIKLLYSSPVSNRQIVLGKFLATMIFGLAMILVLLIICLYGFFAIKSFDFPLVLTGLFGLYLLVCTYAAIGLFMSSLTSYQVVAAVGTFASFFVLQEVGGMWQGVEFVRDITYWLSISGRSSTFITGLICSEDVLYFILVSGLFITFTVLRLKGIREKSPAYVSAMRYTGAFILIALLGYVSTVPYLMGYYDSTRTKSQTLTKNSQEIIAKLKGKVKITTYVNIFGHGNWNGLPRYVKRDIDRFEQYRRFKPDIKMKYAYYYDLPVQEDLLKSHKRRFDGMTIEQALDKSCKSYNVKPKRFKPGESYLEEIDLKAELNRFVRKIETEDGKVSYLRIYDDTRVFPSESQRTAAFNHLVSELPIVGFVRGHEERDVNDFGSRGYHGLAQEKPFRYSLINNGFGFMESDLSKPVDKQIDILVIAESKSPYSAAEIQNLNDYIDRGGNLIIAADRKRQEAMNPLVERFGVTFLPGQIVEHNKGYSMDLITAVFTPEGQKISYRFENIVKREGRVTMPGAVGIHYEETGEFKAIPVMVSDSVHHKQRLDSVGSWIERKTTDFIDEIAKYNPEDGETLGSVTTALALSRKLGDKEQKIMILGDADCFSNGETSRRRKGIRAMNFDMASGMFFWLSDNKVPIDVRRPTPPDNKILTKENQLPFINTIYKIAFPALLALASLLIWLRRRGR